MDILNFTINIIIFALVFLIWQQKKSSSEDFTQVKMHISQIQSEQTEKLLDKLNQNQQQQNQILSQNASQLEQRFTSLQTTVLRQLSEEIAKILQIQNQALHSSENIAKDQKQDLQIQFSQIKTENTEKLQQISQSLQEGLSRAVVDLNQLNKHNFELLAKTSHDHLEQINLQVQKRLDESFQQSMQSFQQVSQNLGQIQITAQKMIDSSKSVDKLNAIFERTNFKAFGDFGEKYLESILSGHLSPSSWQKQVKPNNSNDRLDFLIVIGDKKIGIDAKFPATKYQDYLNSSLEDRPAFLKTYLRGVCEMALDISQKYLQPGFLDVLVLYLPSDGMYAEVANHLQTMEFLRDKKVTPASPTTIFPLIALIGAQQNKLHINANAELIIQGLQKIKKSVLVFQDEFRKLGDKLRQAQQNYDTADRNLNSVQNTVKNLETNKQDEQLAGEVLV